MCIKTEDTGKLLRHQTLIKKELVKHLRIELIQKNEGAILAEIRPRRPVSAEIPEDDGEGGDYEAVSVFFFVSQPQMVTKPTHPSAIPATLPVSSVHLQWDMETSHFLRAPQWRPHKSLHWSASVISNNVKIVMKNTPTND